jgi:leucyl-tRNA synthetase
MKYNTAIAQMMTFVNEVNEKGKLSRGDLRVFVKLLNPVAPHIAEEIWEKMNLGEGYLYEQSWPEYDAKYTVKDEIEIAVQINGKVRERLDVPSKYDKKQIEEFVLANEKVQDLIGDKQIRKIIVVPGRLVNIVVG